MRGTHRRGVSGCAAWHVLVRRDTLILSRNSLSCLPDQIKACANLRVLQLDGNEITELPSAEVWSSITKLESVDLSSNKLTTTQLAKMKGEMHTCTRICADVHTRAPCGQRLDAMPSCPEQHCTALHSAPRAPLVFPCLSLPHLGLGHSLRCAALWLWLWAGLAWAGRAGSLGSTLMSLKVDDNALSSLPLQWDALKLIRHLSASSNKITSLPDEIGLLRQMELLNLEDNEVEDIPFGMAELSEKKFKEINFKGNPLADPRCKRILEREKLPVKPLLAHLKKMAKQGGGGKKNKKKKQQEPEPEPAAAALSVSEMEQRITFVYEQKNQDKVGTTPSC